MGQAQNLPQFFIQGSDNKMANIPQWYQKRIKGFSELSELEQIFEYEALKIRERSRKLGKKLDIPHIKIPKIERPKNVTEKTIEVLKEKSEELKVAPFQPEYTPPNFNETYEYLDEDFDDYEPYSSEYEIAEEFVEDLKTYVQNECSNQIIGHNHYRSGRRVSAKTANWYETNIKRGERHIISLLDNLTSTREQTIDFYKRLAIPSVYGALIDALGEYIASLYVSINAENQQWSKVYSILINGPVSMSDAMDFEDEE